MADGLRARFDMEGGQRLGDVLAWLKAVKTKHGFSDDAIVTASRTTDNRRLLLVRAPHVERIEEPPPPVPDPPKRPRPVRKIDPNAPDITEGLESLAEGIT